MGAGKHVRGSIYLHRSAVAELAVCDRSRIEQAASRAAMEWNVVRVGPEEISLLEYGDFEIDPFPSLRRSALVREEGPVVVRDYTKSANPPILHRKELLVREDHPLRETWAAKTSALVEAGAFKDSHKVGTRDAWHRRLHDLDRDPSGALRR